MADIEQLADKLIEENKEALTKLHEQREQKVNEARQVLKEVLNDKR